MENMKYVLAVFSIIFLFLATSANALPAVPGWSATCFNGTTLIKNADINFNNTLYPFNQTIQCQYGCDQGRDICHRWPGDALPGEYFMLFEILVVALFLIIIFRLDINEKEVKIFDVILPLLSFILFLTLALQSNNVIDMSTGEAVRLIFVLWFNYGMGILCLAFFFLSLFKYISSEVGGGR